MDKMQTVIINYNQSKQINKNSSKTITKKPTKTEVDTYMKIPLLTENPKKSKKVYEFRKIKKQKEMIMTNKVRKGNIDFMQDFNQKFNIYQEQSKKRSSLIEQQLNIQTNQIADRLNQRREKSMNKSLNNPSFNGKRIGKSQMIKNYENNSDAKKQGIFEDLNKFERKSGEIRIDESLGINFDVSFEDKKIKSGII
jgi:hypothetical protein